MKNKFIFIAITFLIHSASYSQKSFKLTGTIKDSLRKETLIGASVEISGIKKYSTGTDLNGQFSLSVLAGQYIVSVYYLGYDSLKLSVNVNSNENLTILLKGNPKLLKQITVVATQNLVTLNGDTTEHNATAYKLNPDATAEDLVKKLPGTTIENGTIKSNGEEIKKVTVDGKNFFGDDVSLTLKNLPADMISTVQIYDKASDQSSLTGFNDGTTTKTMNIKTKNGFKNSIFGKTYVGYGTKEKYDVGGNMNYFSGNRRLSVISNFNNINQQNFAIQDILGAMGMGNMPKMRGGMNPQMMQNVMGPMPGGNDMADYFTNQQSGINTVNAIGLNYSDKWSKNVTFSGSYFFNYNINNTESTLLRQFFLANSNNQLYNSYTTSGSKNTNHRFNLKLEYNIDSANSITITPRFTFQENHSMKSLESSTVLDTLINNNTNSLTKANTNGFMFSGAALYNHKFRKAGRTLSLNVGFDDNKTNGETKLNSDLKYAQDSVTNQNQLTQSKGFGNNYSASLVFSEKIFKSSQLLFSYSPSYSISNNNKSNYNYSNLANDYNSFNSSLSNVYSTNILTNKLGALYAFNKGKINVNAGVYFQDLELSGAQKYPSNFISSKDFKNILPVANFSYKFSFFQTIRLSYKASTTSPTITQMQNVIDNSNPSNLTIGNPNLKQQFDHDITIRYNQINMSSARSVFAFVNVKMSNNYIGNNTFLLFKDTIINSFYVNKGSQLISTQNMNGYASVRSFINYGFKLKPIKCNLNFNLGGNFTRTPVVINNNTNISGSSVITGGLTLSSNISEAVDFTISYSGNYNINKNSIQASQNNNYIYSNIDAKLNIMVYKKIVFSSEYAYTGYSGISSEYNQGVNLLSCSVAYKFLKKKQAEIKASIFDVLNKNKSITRTIASNYIEDNKTNALQQYFMLHFTYTFKKFNSV
ncbi:MAG: outer membrane beta-barrel protein [Bacteroidia bacterium]